MSKAKQPTIFTSEEALNFLFQTFWTYSAKHFPSESWRGRERMIRGWLIRKPDVLKAAIRVGLEEIDRDIHNREMWQLFKAHYMQIAQFGGQVKAPARKQSAAPG